PGGAERFVILPELIAKEPLSPVVRRGDEAWSTLVKGVAFALIEAEENGVTRDNVRTLATTPVPPVVQRLLGTSGGFGKALGVSNAWVVLVGGSVGNYGDVFERNIDS